MAEYTEPWYTKPCLPPPSSYGEALEQTASKVTGEDATQQTRHSEHIPEKYPFTAGQLFHRHTRREEKKRHKQARKVVVKSTIGTRNGLNSFGGFLDIMYDMKKPPIRFISNIVYKMGLTVYFLVNFTYAIFAVSKQADHITFHVVYTLISLTGFVYELIIIIVTIRNCVSNAVLESNGHKSNNTPSSPRDNWRAHEQVDKLNRVFVDYVLSSLGELLIYPTLICVMNGFINERGWEFNNGIFRWYTPLLVYSVLMDALYMKLYVIFLMRRAIRATYKKYDELVKPREMEWKRYFTPFYLSIPLAITTAITHWLMTGIIGVRIYVDNFTLGTNDTNSSIPDTGDYRVAPLTGFMIWCTIYLPIASWTVYIILTKPWFYEVYSAIHQLGNGADRMPNRINWKNKLFASVTDCPAQVYSTITFVMISCINFTKGAYLLDYDSLEYKIASSVKDTIHTLVPLYIFFLLISNLQVVIFIIDAAIVTLVCFYKICFPETF